jgi:adenylate cyclase
MTDLKLRLHLEDNDHSNRIVSVTKSEFIIGRLPECDLCLPFSEVSRHHARIVQNEVQQWSVEDLQSTNGTILNQFQVKSPQTLRNDDIIQIGNTFMTVILNIPQTAKMTSLGTMKEGKTILRNAEELQQQWIQADDVSDPLTTHQTAIFRLQHLVQIAKGLNSAESIEAIFSQVQKVVFQELKSIERLALLVDVEGNGKLKLMNAASKTSPYSIPEVRDINWISQTICQRVFDERVSIKLVDAQNDEDFRQEDSILMQGIRGALAVPLWDQNQVVGVLYADARLRLEHSDPLEDDDLSFFSTLANLVASSVQRWLLSYKLQGEANIRHKLERYHSPTVVQHLIAQGVLDNGRIIPVETDMSILFADLVGFTALSEKLSPQEIAELLNNLFEEMLKSIFDAGGTLDKYIGDCIMAFFGAPEKQLDHADRAAAAALGMLARLDQLNDEQKLWHEPLQLRIAINSGKAVVGDVGSSQRVDYTVLGATVNLASRMESVCAPGECIISDATYQRLTHKEHFIPIGEGRFKGIDRPIMIYQTQRHHTPEPSS